LANKKASTPETGLAGLYLVLPSIEGPRTTYFNSFSGKKKTGNSLADNCCLPAYSPAGSPALPPVNPPFRILEKFSYKSLRLSREIFM
jgi:hypothetical protein